MINILLKYLKNFLVLSILLLLTILCCDRWDFKEPQTESFKRALAKFEIYRWPDTLKLGEIKEGMVVLYYLGEIDSSGYFDYDWTVNSNRVLGLSWAGRYNKRFIHGFGVGLDSVKIEISMFNDHHTTILRKVVVVDSLEVVE